MPIFTRGHGDGFQRATRVCISTIQRLYSILKGEEINDELDEESIFDHTDLFKEHQRSEAQVRRRYLLIWFHCKAYQLFGEELYSIMDELNEVLAA